MKVAVTPRGTQVSIEVKSEPNGGKSMHEVGLIGGTFDRFHYGHKSLIEIGLSECHSLEVWITNDEIAKSKNSLIKKWEERCSEVEQFLDESSSRVSFHSLDDKHGPATSHGQATAIVCTSETISECEKINDIRAEKGLDRLRIISGDRVLAWDGVPISSSRIRSGQIDRKGQPWIPAKLNEGTSILTSKVEAELKEPFGRLFSGPESEPQVAMNSALGEIEDTMDYGCIIAVGDVTVLTLQKIGKIPDIALIDGRTKRQEWADADQIEFSLYDSVMECDSPAGTITDSLINACEDAISLWRRNGSKHLIKVDGEEDLAPLVLHPLAPIGSAVLYGQPGKGVVLRWCDEDSKERCRNLLLGFEKSTG